jgi:Zn-dependent protease
MNHADLIKQILVWLIPGVPAIVFHECAHGWVADLLGDPTARLKGRLSPNPLRHIDPVGTVIVPGLMLLAHLPFLFGWAKPVPVDFRRVKFGRRGVLLVAAAGPLANFIMMTGWLIVAGLTPVPPALLEGPPQSPAAMLAQVALFGAAINLALMVFNLIPIPPLDGGRVLGALLPPALARPYMKLERFGFLILLILIATGVFGMFFTPLLEFFFSKLGLM